MRTARKTAGKRATRKLAPLTVIDWRKYCYDARYKKIFKKDYSDDVNRVRMAKLGYMQLTLCKMLTDANGKSVVNELQFKMIDAPSSAILYFHEWNDVSDFCDNEEVARELIATKGKSITKGWLTAGKQV